MQGTLNLSHVNGFNDKTLSRLDDILEPNLTKYEATKLKTRYI